MTGAGKPKVLFMPEGSILAHVGRCLAIAREVGRERAEVSFAASGAHAAKIDRAGWRRVDVHTLERNELLARLKTGGSAFTVEELRAYVEDERRVLAEMKPDVVVGDFRPSLGISAISLNVQYVCVTNAVWTRHCGVRFDPPRSWPATKKFGAWPLKFLRFLAPSVERRIYAHYAAPFNVVRGEHGLRDLPDIRDCMCSENFNLVADIPEFFPPAADIPPFFDYVGPILWTCDAPAPGWLEKLAPDRRTVYLTMGSTGPLEKIPEIARRLASEGLQVICTMATARTMPEDQYIHTVQFAPGRALCEAADVVVCHAGNGTIYQALSCGRPVIGVPEFHDQDFNMQRVEALGLGVRVDPERLEQELVPRVMRVLNDRRFRERAGEWKRKYGELNGASKAAEWIQKIACPGAIRSGAATDALSKTAG